MASELGDPDKSRVGEALLRLGWRQGVLVASERLLQAAEGGANLRSVAIVEQGTTLIVVSQTCDIIASPDKEPVVEALICSVDQERELGNIANSSRYFAVDPETKLVAYASKRVLIPKDVLLTLVPEEWSWDDDRRRFFVQWLADRWLRADFPKVLVDHFGNPLRDALKKAKKKAPDDWTTLTSQVYQFRVACGEEHHDSPLEVDVRVLVKPSTRPDQLTAIRRFVEPYIDQANRVEGTPLRIDRLRFNTPADFSLADAWAHRPLDFDYLSSDGEEVSLFAEGTE